MTLGSDFIRILSESIFTCARGGWAWMHPKLHRSMDMAVMFLPRRRDDDDHGDGLWIWIPISLRLRWCLTKLFEHSSAGIFMLAPALATSIANNLFLRTDHRLVLLAVHVTVDTFLVNTRALERADRKRSQHQRRTPVTGQTGHTNRSDQLDAESFVKPRTSGSGGTLSELEELELS